MLPAQMTRLDGKTETKKKEDLTGVLSDKLRKEALGDTDFKNADQDIQANGKNKLIESTVTVAKEECYTKVDKRTTFELTASQTGKTGETSSQSNDRTESDNRAQVALPAKNKGMHGMQKCLRF